MSNTYSSYNKWKSTTVYGNFSCIDYAGTTGTRGLTGTTGTLGLPFDAGRISTTGSISGNTGYFKGIGVTGNINISNSLNVGQTGYFNSVSIANNLNVNGNMDVTGVLSGSTGTFNYLGVTGSIKLPNNFIINTTTPSLVDISSSQTLTNKTLTDCVANTQLTTDNSTKIASTAFVKSQNYLTTVGNITDAQLSSNVCLINSTQTLTNKTLTNGIANTQLTRDMFNCKSRFSP